MKVGDLVTTKMSTPFGYPLVGLFIGLRTFKGCAGANDYTCAEVMWFGHTAPNGDPVSTIQHDLIEAINESW